MTRGEIAKQNFLSGLNCSNAVVLAFKDLIKVDEKTLLGLSVGFGGGLARQRLTCGAVSGIAIVLGYIHKDKTKQEIYEIIQNACNDYKKEVGSLICGELLSGVKTKEGLVAEERNEEYYKKRPCADLCLLAGNVIEKYI